MAISTSPDATTKPGPIVQKDVLAFDRRNIIIIIAITAPRLHDLFWKLSRDLSAVGAHEPPSTSNQSQDSQLSHIQAFLSISQNLCILTLDTVAADVGQVERFPTFHGPRVLPAVVPVLW